jgi:hypothetical protein
MVRRGSWLLAGALFLATGCASSASVAASRCPGDRPQWDRAPFHLTPIHVIRLDSRQSLTLDGRPIRQQDLISFLDEARWRDPLSPTVAFENPRKLACGEVALLHNLLASTLACREGHCAEVEPSPWWH